MQFSSLFVVAAAATAAQALIHLTDPTFAGISAGVPFEVTWADAEGDVTLILLDDTNPNDFKTLETLATGLTGTAYTWVPPSTLINAFDYALQVGDSVTSNYGAQFQFVGGVTPTTSATVASSTEATQTTDASSEPTSSPSVTSAPSTLSTLATSQPFTNSTTSRGTGTGTSSGSSSPTKSGPGSQTSAPSSANSIATPLALIFLTVAAMISLN